MRKLLQTIGGATTVLDLLGSGLIVAGTAMVYTPASFMVGGAALLAISYQAARPAARDEDGDE